MSAFPSKPLWKSKSSSKLHIFVGGTLFHVVVHHPPAASIWNKLFVVFGELCMCPLSLEQFLVNDFRSFSGIRRGKLMQFSQYFVWSRKNACIFHRDWRASLPIIWNHKKRSINLEWDLWVEFFMKPILNELNSSS